MKNFYEEAKSPDLLCADKKRIIPPKHDVMFKILFGNHKKYLADLLSKILKIENLNEEDITYLNSEQIPDLPGAKSSRMDLSIKVNDELLNIEVQVQNHDSYKDRCLYYWSKLFSGSLNKGSNYKDLKKAIVINFLDFKLFDDKDVFHEVVAVVKDSEQIFSDKFGLFFFELPNLSGTINVDEEILLWLKFLSAESREELKMLKESSNTVIKDAVDDVFATSEEIEA